MAPRTFRERVDLRLLGCVLLSVLVGIFLRVWRAGSPLLFQDELFAVAAAADLRYTQILTHFGLFFDHCIPLSLYAKLLTDTIGLDEWTLRLPGIVAGVATLCLGPPAGDLLHGWALKGTRGHMTLGTVATGLMLLLPTPVEAPLLFWLALAALGFVALGRRHPRESAILSAMTVVQVLALRLAQPMGVEAPHICLRYLAH